MLFGPVLALWLLAAGKKLLADPRDMRTFACCLALFAAALAVYPHLPLTLDSSVKFLGEVGPDRLAGYVSREYFTVQEQAADFPRRSQRSAAAASTLAWIPSSFTAVGGMAGLARPPSRRA